MPLGHPLRFEAVLYSNILARHSSPSPERTIRRIIVAVAAAVATAAAAAVAAAIVKGVLRFQRSISSLNQTLSLFDIYLMTSPRCYFRNHTIVIDIFFVNERKEERQIFNDALEYINLVKE